MRLIIAGSRTINRPPKIIDYAMNCFDDLRADEVELVISGACAGPDMIGARWAAERRIDVLFVPALWEQGKGAGFRRNRQMAELGTHLLAIWDGVSHGTEHMIGTARIHGLDIYVLKWEAGH